MIEITEKDKKEAAKNDMGDTPFVWKIMYVSISGKQVVDITDAIMLEKELNKANKNILKLEKLLSEK